MVIINSTGVMSGYKLVYQVADNLDLTFLAYKL